MISRTLLICRSRSNSGIQPDEDPSFAHRAAKHAFTSAYTALGHVLHVHKHQKCEHILQSARCIRASGADLHGRMIAFAHLIVKHSTTRSGRPREVRFVSLKFSMTAMAPCLEARQMVSHPLVWCFTATPLAASCVRTQTKSTGCHSIQFADCHG